MMETPRVLAPVDFSERSTYALDFSADLLNRLGMKELHLVHADVLHADPVSFDEMYGMPVRSADDESRRGSYLEDQLDKIAAGYDSSLNIVKAVVRDISVAPALLQYAQDHDISLIVMGTHGRRGLRRWLLGSVAEEMVQLAECPTLTVRTPDESSRQNIRRILVPVDFSVHSREALVYARAIAKATQAPITLFHVVQDQFHPAFYTPVVQSIYNLNPRIEEQMVEKLQVFMDETPGDEVPYNVDVRFGHPADTIVTEAETTDADLIVMATHGLTGLEHFFMGSVTERVVRLASCPVFTVKSFGKSLLSDSTQSLLSDQNDVQ